MSTRTFFMLVVRAHTRIARNIAAQIASRRGRTEVPGARDILLSGRGRSSTCLDAEIFGLQLRLRVRRSAQNRNDNAAHEP
ncbi:MULTISPECIES: hypothetical protein [unclassified Caballeronia]|uniref:hypothetical protein n=1 Tax=unclassified Caballeronia TaxID=2646786 RepID=UPI00286BA987|nr:MULTISPECIES: hypothetical protein [unclassified Caballeronia]